MGINCILIELYFEMLNGLDTSNQNGYNVKDAYTTILPLLDNRITNEMATIFYRDVRYKIIHQGANREGHSYYISCRIHNLMVWRLLPL